MAKKTETEKGTVAEENSIARYIRETRGELRKVTWPTREEAIRLTAIVLGVTAAFAVFFWVLDVIFASGIETLIEWLIQL